MQKLNSFIIYCFFIGIFNKMSLIYKQSKTTQKRKCIHRFKKAILLCQFQIVKEIFLDYNCSEFKIIKLDILFFFHLLFVTMQFIAQKVS